MCQGWRKYQIQGKLENVSEAKVRYRELRHNP